jgi:hypothetical protein
VTLRSSASRNCCTLLSLRPAAGERPEPPPFDAALRLLLVLAVLDREPVDLVAI